MAEGGAQPVSAVPKVLEGLYGKLADQWATALFTPAFLFWVAGFLVWAFRDGRDVFWDNVQEELDWLQRQGTAGQLVYVAAGLLLILVSALVVDALLPTILRLFEGHWPRPFRGRRRARIDKVTRTYDQKRLLWNQLASTVGSAGQWDRLTLEQREEYAKLDEWLMRTPAAANRRQATRLGNILAAAEDRSEEKYGLDNGVCWPRLWLLLSEDIRTEVTTARGIMEARLRVIVWVTLSLVWAGWLASRLPLEWDPNWLALIAWLAVATAVIVVAYQRLLGATAVYGDTIEAAFDAKRTTLYESLRWPLPRDPATELAAGRVVSQYLWRGSDRPLVEFTGEEDTLAPAPEPVDERGFIRRLWGSILKLPGRVW